MLIEIVLEKPKLSLYLPTEQNLGLAAFANIIILLAFLIPGCFIM